MEVEEKPKAYLIGNDIINNEKLIEAIKSLYLEPVNWDQDKPPFVSNSELAIYIFNDFHCPTFESLKRRSPQPKIFGPTAVIQVAEIQGNIFKQNQEYPIYCTFLKNCKISVTGTNTKDELLNLRRFILYMGGTFVERESTQLTHLVAGKCRGVKYRNAVALGKPILKPEWIMNLWQNRNERFFDINFAMDEYKVQAFYSSRIAFNGFESQELANMTKLVEENGGVVVQLDDPSATHIVVGSSVDPDGGDSSVLMGSQDSPLPIEETRSPLKRARLSSMENVVNDMDPDGLDSIVSKVSDIHERAKLLKVEWFWSSIQIEACAEERPYLLNNNNNTRNESMDFGNASLGSITSPLVVYSDSEGNTPKSAGRRKRKRTRDFISSLAHVEYPNFLNDVPEESLSFTSNLNLEKPNSFDECPDNVFSNILKQVNHFLSATDARTLTKRQINFYELLSTERNYVNILITIVKTFKEPCEDESTGRRILNTQEVKTIFGNLLPIYSVHKRLLRDLFSITNNWSDENIIVGKVITEYAKDLQRAYEPFVNFFESCKAEISRCENEKPRFMALLKIAQGKPECGKQKLPELMIRPIQRLPSFLLILKALSDHTPKTNPDSEWLGKALEAINQVNQNINEERRVNEARVAMFEIYREIEGCPPHLLSAQRSLLHKLDMTGLSEPWSSKNDLTLCVFSDHTQIVKRRKSELGRSLSNASSVVNLRSPSMGRKSTKPGPINHNQHSRQPYKFIEFIYHKDIKRVVDITNMSHPAFAFIVRGESEIRERILSFTVPDGSVWNKTSILNLFSKLVADASNRVDYENYIVQADYNSLSLNETTTIIEKATKFASKTRHKVGRALSMSRTPSKVLKRTVSQMISPFTGRNCGDSDSISQGGGEMSTTPLRSNLSTMSLSWFGSKRGTMDPPSTPKARRAILDRGGQKKDIFEKPN